jgi:endoglucanase
MYKKVAFVCALLSPLLMALHAQNVRYPASGIRIDQVGFYPQAPKMAVVAFAPSDTASSSQAASTSAVSSSGTSAAATPSSAAFVALSPDIPFYILSATLKDTVFSGILGPLRKSANSSLLTRMAEFSKLEKEGSYIIAIRCLPDSYPFRIGKQVLHPVVVTALKGYYYMRSGMALDPRYAGKWSRAAGHPDTQVLVHPSAVSAGRMSGTVIATPGGWYDAGDYNKYVVNSGITMGTLLSAYEDFSSYLDTLHTNIPGDATLPDILRECLYNLRWMLSMQDPSDGGVYNKCTNAAFDGMVMPDFTKAPRWVVQKGTAATLDFAAVMAQASRIFRKFKGQRSLSDSCLAAAAAAWQWAVNNPALVYDQAAMNKQYEPKITTGGYGDRDFRDEWFWAAAELMASTQVAGDKTPAGPQSGTSYRSVVDQRIQDPMSLPSWNNVAMLGNYTLLRCKDRLPASLRPALDSVRRRLLLFADQYLDKLPASAFHTVMGQSPRDFIWGSNSVAANQGILLIHAWLQTRDNKYMDNAVGNLDYLLGRNASGYCFITGIGSRSTMHPHHRPSVADGIVEPVPGLLAGGPNPGRQDHCQYEFTEPETAYLDQDAAYASNEIAINWNAPLVYLAAAVEALQYRDGYSAH